MVTQVLDLGIITPLTILSGYLILKREFNGYKLFFCLAGIIILLFPMICLGTYLQLKNGINFSTGEIAGPVTGFLVLGLTALGMAIWIFKKADRINIY